MDYVENFINSVDFETDESKNLAFILFESEEDCKDFYISFFGRNRYIIDDLLDYREKKISNMKVTIDKLNYMYHNGVKHKVLEKVFLQPFSADDASLIDLAIKSGRLSLDTILYRFKNNVNENVLKNVL